MAPSTRSRSWLVLPMLVGVLVLAACGPAAAPAAQPAAPQPGAPAQAPAAQPAKPAVQPAKPATEPAQPAAQPVVELRAGTSNAPDFTNSRGVAKFAELVSQKTNGQVVVHVFYQSLGVQQQLAQTVMAGSVDLGDLSNGNAGRFTSAFFNFDLPFLFRSYDTMLKALDGPIARKAMEQFEKDLGVKIMFPLSWGIGRDIQTTKKQLKVPADIKGLKIRVVSTPVDLAIFKAWGANPTPVDWAQTYTALQQGVVDGEQVPITVLGTNKHYEVVKYSVHVEYQAGFEPFYINAKKFESLKPEYQKALLEAAQEAKAWHHKDAAQRAAKAAEELTTQHGMVLYTPTPDEYNQWVAIREQVWNEVAKEQPGKIDLNVAKQLYASQ